MSATKLLRIFVVEDEAMLAMMLEDMLTDIGHTVVAVASRLADAVELAQTLAIDAAIVDVNLAGHASYPIADALAKRGIPFAFSTGYGARGIDAKYADFPVLAKPFASTDLAAVLARLAPQ